MRHLSLVAVGGLALVGVASSQVEWNEMPLPEGTFREYAADYRTDVIEIPLGALEELEYKLGLNEGDAWIAPMRERFVRARDRLTDGLRDAGYAVLGADSTYFLCVDLAASGVAADDEAFAEAAVEKAGVAVVPLSAFFEERPVRHLVRLCFAKRDETIDSGIAAMARARELFA